MPITLTLPRPVTILSPASGPALEHLTFTAQLFPVIDGDELGRCSSEWIKIAPSPEGNEVQYASVAGVSSTTSLLCCDTLSD